jgi:Xaa-Pro aminopeptidase
MNNSEINNVKKACQITTEILSKLLANLKKNSFETELDIANFLKKETYKRGCRLAFKPIAAIGKNAAEIHHKPNETKLHRGFLVIDFGVRYKGYCSDCTRTFYLGKPNKKEKELYNLVLLAQETGIMYSNPGEYAANIDLIVRAALWKYFKNFVHGTGHGVGKRIHQSPNLKPRGRRILRKDMIITVEPGLYFKKKLGIRIEDTILIKEKAYILTRLTKRLVIVNGYS